MYTRLFSNPRAWRSIALACALGVFAAGACAQNASIDPPDRVARIGYMSGNVSFQSAGASNWVQASLNRPLGTGDKLYTDNDSRIELQIGSGAIRLDANTTFNLLNLDDRTAQIELSEGVMNLNIRRIDSGETFEVDTPTLAFVINRPGTYRVDIAPRGGSTMVTVFDGAGAVYGENNASYSVRAGNSYRFYDSALRDYEVLDLPRADDFDRWCSARDSRYERSVSRRYVSEGTIGYADLDDNGYWTSVPEYGDVWYPTTVAAGWAPYRSGHWAWIDPWGWSWVDNASWGFAPFHYGRWAYIGNRWGWCPGRRSSGFAIYAPAVVGFIGGGGWGASISIGGGGPVGWFPLGPRDVYVPWYRTSRNYFTNINVRNTTIVNNTYITNVYNNYSNGRPIDNANYAYRSNSAAVTAVSRDTFIGARPVNANRVVLDANQLRNTQVISRVGIAPTQTSFLGGNSRAGAVPAAAVLDRQVIARTAPPPRPVPIASRLQAIQSNGAQPLAQSQLHQIASRPAVAEQERALPARVQVVGRGNASTPAPLPARSAGPVERQGAESSVNARTPREAAAGAARSGERSAPAAADRSGEASTGRVVPNRSELPSSRFAPHSNASQDGERARPALPTRGAAAIDQPQRSAPVTRDTQRGDLPSRSMTSPQAIERSQPPRTTPLEREPQRTAPTPAYQRTEPMQRSTPAESRDVPARDFQRSAPIQQREAPVRDFQRSAPIQQREMPVQDYQRGAPVQQREAPVRDFQRSAPVQQREMPVQDYHRSAPVQQREMPVQQQRAMPQQRQAEPQHTQPAERRAPAREDKRDKDDNNH